MRRMLEPPPSPALPAAAARGAHTPGAPRRAGLPLFASRRPSHVKLFIRDLELHAAQLQALMRQALQERDFVRQENAQLRLAVKGLFKAHASSSAAKAPPVVIAVNISKNETRDVHLDSPQDIDATVANLSAEHRLNPSQGRAIRRKLEVQFEKEMSVRRATAASAATIASATATASSAAAPSAPPPVVAAASAPPPHLPFDADFAACEPRHEAAAPPPPAEWASFGDGGASRGLDPPWQRPPEKAWPPREDAAEWKPFSPEGAEAPRFVRLGVAGGEEDTSAWVTGFEAESFEAASPLPAPEGSLLRFSCADFSEPSAFAASPADGALSSFSHTPLDGQQREEGGVGEQGRMAGLEAPAAALPVEAAPSPPLARHGSSSGGVERRLEVLSIPPLTKPLGMTLTRGPRLVVQAVKGGGAAEEAGMRVGDQFIEVNGTRVESSQAVRQLLNPRETNTISVLRAVAESSLAELQALLDAARVECAIATDRRTAAEHLAEESGAAAAAAAAAEAAALARAVQAEAEAARLREARGGDSLAAGKAAQLEAQLVELRAELASERARAAAAEERATESARLLTSAAATNVEATALRAQLSHAEAERDRFRAIARELKRQRDEAREACARSSLPSEASSAAPQRSASLGAMVLGPVQGGGGQASEAACACRDSLQSSVEGSTACSTPTGNRPLMGGLVGEKGTRSPAMAAAGGLEACETPPRSALVPAAAGRMPGAMPGAVPAGVAVYDSNLAEGALYLVRNLSAPS